MWLPALQLWQNLNLWHPMRTLKKCLLPCLLWSTTSDQDIYFFTPVCWLRHSARQFTQVTYKLHKNLANKRLDPFHRGGRFGLATQVTCRGTWAQWAGIGLYLQPLRPLRARATSHHCCQPAARILAPVTYLMLQCYRNKNLSLMHTQQEYKEKILEGQSESIDY